jgi:hypothetical protein
MTLFCDNTTAIEISNNPVQHDRTKHVELDRNNILDTDKIKVPYIKSADQLVDMMTHVVPYIKRIDSLLFSLFCLLRLVTLRSTFHLLTPVLFVYFNHTFKL